MSQFKLSEPRHVDPTVDDLYDIEFITGEEPQQLPEPIPPAASEAIASWSDVDDRLRGLMVQVHHIRLEWHAKLMRSIDEAYQ